MISLIIFNNQLLSAFTICQLPVLWDQSLQQSKLTRRHAQISLYSLISVWSQTQECLFCIKVKDTHEYWAQDACSKAYEEPFHPGAVAERAGIKDLVRTMGGCQTTNLMTCRKTQRLSSWWFKQFSRSRADNTLFTVLTSNTETHV